MATEEALSAYFEEYGFEVDAKIAAKCVELCITYNLSDAKDFVESYVAFSVNNLNGVEPTVNSLNEFERKELATNQINAKPSKTRSSSNKRNDYDPYDDMGMDIDDDGGDDLMGSYIGTTPKTPKNRSSHIFATPRPDGRSPSNTASPITGATKDVAGKAVCTFGTGALVKSIESINWTSTKLRQNLHIVQLPGKNGKQFTVNQTYMMDTMQQKCGVAADRIYENGMEICAKLINDRPNEYTTELYTDLSHVNVSSTTTIKCLGRVCSDSDCQLTTTSTLLIGADESDLRSVHMNFNRMRSYGLFPGQTIFVRGLNPRRDTLYVDEIFAERQLKMAAAPRLTQSLNIVMAAGPFSLGDGLDYKPLDDLKDYCVDHKPHAVILMGPFLDADHKSVQNCTLKITFETHFERLIRNFMEGIGPETEVLIVSSHRDIISTTVYPTHPYTVRQSFKNLRFLPDPCTITINGVTIGMTSTDIFSHICEMELVQNMGDKVRRVIKYLFHEASFYPLNPTSHTVCLDSGLAQNFAAMPTVPNVLIMSSTQRSFVRDLNGCLVVNPGQVTENGVRGTFGRLVITPATDEQKALNSFMACQIMKL